MFLLFLFPLKDGRCYVVLHISSWGQEILLLCSVSCFTEVWILLIIQFLVFKIHHPNECSLSWVLKMMMNTFLMISSLKWMNYASGMEKNMNGEKPLGMFWSRLFQDTVLLFQRIARWVWLRIFTVYRSCLLNSCSANQNLSSSRPLLV